MSIEWKEIKKNYGVIYKADGIDKAVVDNKGLGTTPGIWWNGKRYKSVEAAKRAAEESLEDEKERT